MNNRTPFIQEQINLHAIRGEDIQHLMTRLPENNADKPEENL